MMYWSHVHGTFTGHVRPSLGEPITIQRLSFTPLLYSGEMPPLRWQQVPRLPRPCAAVLAVLNFAEPSAELLVSLRENEWDQALRFCDRSQLTLVFGDTCRSHLPDRVRARIEQNFTSNSQRLGRLKQEYLQIADYLNSHDVGHVVLKGFLQAPQFVRNARLRMQYDLDLLCAREKVQQAQKLLRELGFDTVQGQERLPIDHLPPMVRRTDWHWKGNYFDPDIPPIVELHFQLWDERTERIQVTGLDKFWLTRTQQLFDKSPVPALDPVNQLGYAALHALRHLLRGDLKPAHVLELAHFLENQRNNQELWRQWEEWHDASLRQLETVSCLLAEAWFGCRLPQAIQAEVALLSRDVHGWFADFAASPLTSQYRPNKDELWLHLAMLPRLGDRIRVTRRRLLPLRLPGHVDAMFLPAQHITPYLRWRKWTRYAAFLAGRLRFHCTSLLRMVLVAAHRKGRLGRSIAARR